MYNRYIPQPDGSYRRNQQQDHTAPKPPPPKPAPPPPPIPEVPKQAYQPTPSPTGITNFFRQLLPPNIDTADLLIILLLLLMAGDNEKERNHALLTMALYFFM